MKPEDGCNGMFSDTELQAYIDNQLDPQRHKLIQAYLAEHPGVDATLQVRDYQAINQNLHAAFNAVLDEPIPERLQQVIKVQGARTRTRIFRPWLQAATLATVLLLGCALGWLLRGYGQNLSNQAQILAANALPEQALLAHNVYTRERRHAVEVVAEEEKHLVAWLSKRLGKEMRAPQLSTLGFELLGGRLLASNDGPAAHFMYQNEDGQRLTLFVLRKPDVDAATAFQFTRKDKISTFYWIDGELGYALSGDIGKARLSELARFVEKQLQSTP